MKKFSFKGKRIALITFFMAVVLAPGVALGLLALRAADRESVYVERRMESALLAEVDLAARGIDALINDIHAELEHAADSESSNWLANPLVAVSFAVQGGSFVMLDAPSHEARAAFVASFGSFLTGDARIPVYEGIAGVYRREMSEVEDKAEKYSSVPRTDAMKKIKQQEQADSNDSPKQNAETMESRPAPSAAPAKGIDRQRAQSVLAASPVLRDEAYRQAEDEGFEISQRNVAPVAQNVTQIAADERSTTVSRGETFAAITSSANSGLLPRVTDDGLEILFWAKKPGGEVTGCTLDMYELRDRIAGAMPDILNELRILTVLDDTGSPIVAPETTAVPDWRSPFVAREISPALPRWEVGAWLVDPALITSRAEYARRTVWVLVASLFAVLTLGGAGLIRAVFAEMRIARQKTTFVANVSHELKTPLTSIRLFAELLLSGKQSDENKKNEYLRTMVSETERLSSLVDNVLSFSRSDGGSEKKFRAERVSLGEVVRETCGQMEPHLTRQGFSIRSECAEELPVIGDREALRQVLMNMLANAEKYSGEVREIDVSCCERDGFACLSVADRGIGVEPRDADRIFDEFYRADDSLSAMRSGTGLGLSIARNIARKHGGDVTYAPRRGGGSVFTLCLPKEAN